MREEGEKYDFCGNVNRETAQTKKGFGLKGGVCAMWTLRYCFVTIDAFYLKYDLII